MSDLAPSPTSGRTHDASVAASTESPRLLMATLVMVTATTSVVSSLGGSLVPQVAIQYEVSLGSAQWVLTGALLAGAVTTPVIGRLGGTTRRRTVINVTLAVVAVGLALSALPLGYPGLIVGRLLQGSGLGLLPLALAAARDGLPSTRVGRALALLSITTVMGAGLSYPVAAWIGQAWGLSAAYWAGFVATVLTLLMALLVIPHPVTTGGDDIHWWGAALLTIGTSAVLVALTLAPAIGVQSPWVLTLLTVGAAALGLWVRTTLRHPRPLVDLRLATRPEVLPAHIASLIAGVAVYMLLALVMIQVQLPVSSGFGLGRPLAVAGLMLAPYAVLTFTGSRVSRTVGDRVGLDTVLPIGGTLYAIATILFAVSHQSILTVVAVMALAGFGSGFTFAAMPGLVLLATPMQETGSAMAFNTLLRFLGFAVGSTLATSVLAAMGHTSLSSAGAFVATVWVNASLWVAMVGVVVAMSVTQSRSRRDGVSKRGTALAISHNHDYGCGLDRNTHFPRKTS